MKFSLIIPCYNEEKVLPSLLESIRKLEYPRQEIEVIVVDNNCTDKTREVAQSYGVEKIVEEKNQGLTWARQKGFLSAEGDIVYSLDSDCQLPPKILKKVESYFTNPQVVAVSGPYDYYDLNPFIRRLFLFFQIIFYPWFPKFLSFIFRKPAALVIGGNCAIRKETLKKIKGFDTQVRFWGEDVFLALRLAKVGKVIFAPNLKIFSSGRRFRNEGYIKTFTRYFLNYFWIYFFGKPFVKES